MRPTPSHVLASHTRPHPDADRPSPPTNDGDGGRVLHAEERARLRAIDAAGTPAPWHVCRDEDGVAGVAAGATCDEEGPGVAAAVDTAENAALVVEARNALRPLLDALDEADRKHQRTLEALDPEANSTGTLVEMAERLRGDVQRVTRERDEANRIIGGRLRFTDSAVGCDAMARRLAVAERVIEAWRARWDAPNDPATADALRAALAEWDREVK